MHWIIVILVTSLLSVMTNYIWRNTQDNIVYIAKALLARISSVTDVHCHLANCTTSKKVALNNIRNMNVVYSLYVNHYSFA